MNDAELEAIAARNAKRKQLKAAWKPMMEVRDLPRNEQLKQVDANIAAVKASFHDRVEDDVDALIAEIRRLEIALCGYIPETHLSQCTLAIRHKPEP